MREPILIRPVSSPERLVLLFHGVGSTAEAMIPLGQQIAAALPRAAVFSVPSPDPSDLGQGYQWFSVRGVTEANRLQRVAQAMPRFIQAIEKLHQSSGVAAAQTTLVGFSQGAIMALEASQLTEPPAGRVAAIAGRFAQPPHKAPASTTLHLLHGDADPVIASSFSVTAAERLNHLGADVTLDLIPGLGHGINPAAAERLIDRLVTDGRRTRAIADAQDARGTLA